MKRTIRTRKGSVTLNVSTQERLVYTLKRTGLGAAFVLADKFSTNSPILSMDNLGGPLQAVYTWELRSALDNGQAVITVHKTDGSRIGPHEFRAANFDDFRIYTVALSFMFLGKYTLVAKHADQNSKELTVITDIDFEGESNTDTAESSVTVQITR